MSLTDGEKVAAARVTFEETPERLKVIIPLQRHRFLLALYSFLLLFWAGSTLYTVLSVTQSFNLDVPGRFLFIWSLIIALLLLVWLWFGRRFLWRSWQYYAADRELLFINKERLIVRRPVSLLGLTDAYDMRYVSPFYYSDRHGSLAFDYGRRGVLLAPSLPRPNAVWLLVKLNDRYFPGWNEEEDDE